MKNDHKWPAPPRIVIEMWLGIALFNCLCILIGIWFVPDRARFLTGLLPGAALACAGSYHIWATLDRSVDSPDEKTAARRVGTGYIIRYIALIALVLILYFTGIGSPFAAFVGYLGLKPAAYMQPTVHKMTDRFLQRR